MFRQNNIPVMMWELLVSTMLQNKLLCIFGDFIFVMVYEIWLNFEDFQNNASKRNIMVYIITLHFFTTSKAIGASRAAGGPGGGGLALGAVRQLGGA